MGIITTAMEIVGAACLAAAGFLIVPALGFAVTGVCLLGLGWLLGRDA